MTKQEHLGLAIKEGVRQGLSACEAADRYLSGVPFPEEDPVPGPQSPSPGLGAPGAGNGRGGS